MDTPTQNTLETENQQLKDRILQMEKELLFLLRKNYVLENQKYSYNIPCCVCYGVGYFKDRTICPACSGQGKVTISPLFRLDKTQLNHIKDFIKTGNTQ